jgi:hypothetical protein
VNLERDGVAPGQRYRPRGSSFSTWEVVDFVQPAGEPLLHVRLKRVGVPSEAKTIAARVLRDSQFYRPVE